MELLHSVTGITNAILTYIILQEHSLLAEYIYIVWRFIHALWDYITFDKSILAHIILILLKLNYYVITSSSTINCEYHSSTIENTWMKKKLHDPDRTACKPCIAITQLLHVYELHCNSKY